MSNTIIETIQKSPYDNNQYRYILLENKLKILLISDKTTNLSAASLCVGVGNLSDGDVYGMAHFLEHMLFMGNKKYPKEDYYHKMVSKAGGLTNAYTSSDHTNYYFTVDPEKFTEVIDIFGHFFIDPLLKEDALDREMNAVDAEHNKNIINDEWRFNTMINVLAGKESPIANFSTGTLETLNIPNIKDKVLDFYKKYYSANNMTLVVLDKQPLDLLEKTIVSIFSDVPNNLSYKPNDLSYKPNDLSDKPNNEITHKYSYPKIFMKNNVRIEMKPIKNKNTLFLLWEVEDDFKYYKTHAINYITHLVGHEGKGSVTCILKKICLIETLNINTDIYGGRNIIKIIIELTATGKNYINTIIHIMCEYILLIKKNGITKEYYNELRDMDKQIFTFSDKINPEKMVTELSTNIQLFNEYINIENILNYNSLYDDFSQDIINLIDKYLSQLTIDNLNIILSAPSLKKTEHVEKWYGIKYNIYDNLKINPIENYDEYQKKIYIKILSNLSLPHPNYFISSIFDTKLKQIADSTIQPIKKNVNNITLYYKPNTIVNLPKTNIICIITSKWLDLSKTNRIILKLLIRIIDYMYLQEIYYIQLAGYNCIINIETNKLILIFSGITHKIDKVITDTLDTIFNIKFNETIFDLQKKNNIKKIRK